MGQEEHWRLRLLELKKYRNLSQAEIAAAIDVAPSYVSRLLYEPGKSGRKNLGLNTLRALQGAYHLPAGWFDLPLGTGVDDVTAEADPDAVTARDPGSSVTRLDRPFRWPFHNVTYGRLEALRESLGPRAAQEALRDIDALLDVAVTKWERAALGKNRRTN